MAEPAGAERWLAEARAGSTEALGRALEECRNYLLLIAQRELDPHLQPKGGASDLVQETFLDAQRGFGQFRGDSPAELRAWLRTLLRYNVVSFARRYREAGKRESGREVGLPANDWSRLGGGEDLAAADPSPSRQAMDHEEQVLIERAMGQLPDDYRRVLVLRYREGREFEEIGRELGRSAEAARKLWLRAFKRLQKLTEGRHDSGSTYP